MQKNIKDIYDSQFGAAFILPKGYDSSYEKRSIKEIKTFADGVKTTITGKIFNFRIKRVSSFSNIYADIVNGEDKFMLHWPSSSDKAEYKMRMLKESLDEKICDISGTISSFGTNENRLVYLSKIKLKDNNDADQASSLSPNYELKKGVKHFELLKEIKESINSVIHEQISMPIEIEKELTLPSLIESLEIVHCLKTDANLDEMLMLQATSVYHKRIKMELIWRTLVMLDEDNNEDASPILSFSKETMQELESFLNVSLTQEQKFVLGKIFKTFQNGIFKRTLLQGDVGSGKTFVSIFAALTVLENGNQVAVLAPSTVLAKQLFEEYEKAIKKYKIFFINSSTTKKQKELINITLKTEPCVVIGTSSVNSLEFTSLGLVVVDEEQKFGVVAKDFLINKDFALKPYQILMTATPVPRSLASAMFGNVDVVAIKAKPAGRIDVKTKIIDSKDQIKKLFDFIKKEKEINGNLALIVVPAVESEDIGSVETVLNLMSNFINKEQIITIHGKMSEKEIDTNVQIYKNNEKTALIATSMVDAGFSLPNISTVVIIDPDRFGLSQLHQIRGRAGRSNGLQSFCALFPLSLTLKDKVFERLTMFSENFDGFFLANEDLNNRGSGKLIGTKQSGGGDVDFINNFEEVLILKDFLKKLKT